MSSFWSSTDLARPSSSTSRATPRPVLNGVLAPLGGRLTAFSNQGRTETLPGHATLLTGPPRSSRTTDGAPDPPDPLRAVAQGEGTPPVLGLDGGGKDKFSALTYSTYAGYGSAYGASLNVALSRRSDDLCRGDGRAGGQPADVHVPQPGLVDLTAHSGNWTGYLSALGRADSLAGALWDFIQADPKHGRGHGLDRDRRSRSARRRPRRIHFSRRRLPGCRTLFLIARGPDFLAGVTSYSPRRQKTWSHDRAPPGGEQGHDDRVRDGGAARGPVAACGGRSRGREDEGVDRLAEPLHGVGDGGFPGCMGGGSHVGVERSGTGGAR